MAFCLSALSRIVANGHQVLPSFPPPLQSFRTAGFPQCGWKPAFPQHLPSPFRKSLAAGLAADQSLPPIHIDDRPTRLRQSLSWPGSPRAGVGYDYPAQPPIAEAGPSPAGGSKNEGCTQGPTFIFNSISARWPSRNFSFLPGRHGCSSPSALIASNASFTAFLSAPP
jgi:hypothetical protein